MSSRTPAWALLALALACTPPGARAQSLRVEGAARDSASLLIRGIADRGAYLLLARDTVLPASFRHAGDLVVDRARVRLEGTVEGRVAVVGGDLFVRPGARVVGPIAVAGGAVHPSGLATMGPVLEVPPEIGVRIGAGPDGAGPLVTLTPPPAPPRVRPTGLFGLGAPTYDRVNGLTLRGGAQLRLGADPEGARARAQLHYHVARGALGGVAGVEAPLRPGIWGVVEAGRVSVTNDAWIRGDLTNTLAALFSASDIRDYWSSDYLAARLERRRREPLVEGEIHFGPWVGVRVSRDRSLRSRDPWSLLDGDGWRENPPVLEERIASALAGADFEWRGALSRLEAATTLEWAPGAGALDPFAQGTLDALASFATPRGHTVELRTHLIGTLADVAAPPQRRSHVGGTGTLPTEPDAVHLGDQLVFTHSVYAVPLPRVAVPYLGAPSLTVQHAAGMAWLGDRTSPRWRQNLGGGVRFRLLHADLWIDPAEGWSEPSLKLGADLPF